MKPQYFIEVRFGLVIVERLARSGKTVAHLARHLDVSEQEIMEVFTGETGVGGVITFGALDTYFSTTPGYFQQMYENCSKVMQAEMDETVIEEVVEPDPFSDLDIPEGYMLVPISLARDVVDQISYCHDHDEETLKFLALVEKAEGK